ncbi:hypothetical protein [Bacillus sp. UMB0728]|uniref:hypothetical protein n=1 Tax=Bacillus sp. UMB0728 TaxID=2066052 RepID=UPI000C790AB3|nr:hypothetical protein [Bacillus sp. UMB0728]PLR72337.1 hypothetical protein CYJ37_12335 [Bacillus sp. UMB0728]
MSLETLNERITRVEERSDQFERRIGLQEEKNDSLIRLVTQFENQERSNLERERRYEDRDKRQQEQMDRFATTLSNIDLNLTNLNNSQEKLTSTQEQLGERVSDIEGTLQSQNINAVQVFMKILGYVGTLLGGIIMAYVLFKLNL